MSRDEALAMRGSRSIGKHPPTPDRVAHYPGRYLGRSTTGQQAARVDRRLTELITDEGPIAVTEPVVMELAAGARTDQCEDGPAAAPAQIRLAHLRRCCRLRCHGEHLQSVPAGRCHSAGTIDCMITAVALATARHSWHSMSNESGCRGDRHQPRPWNEPVVRQTPAHFQNLSGCATRWTWRHAFHGERIVPSGERFLWSEFVSSLRWSPPSWSSSGSSLSLRPRLPLFAATGDSRRRQPRLCVLLGRRRLYRRSSTVGRGRDISWGCPVCPARSAWLSALSRPRTPRSRWPRGGTAIRGAFDRPPVRWDSMFEFGFLRVYRLLYGRWRRVRGCIRPDVGRLLVETCRCGPGIRRRLLLWCLLPDGIPLRGRGRDYLRIRASPCGVLARRPSSRSARRRTSRLGALTSVSCTTDFCMSVGWSEAGGGPASALMSWTSWERG